MNRPRTLPSLLTLLSLLTLFLSACGGESATPAASGAESAPEATATAPAAPADEGDVEVTAAPADRSFAGEVPAPDFPPGLDWLNTGGPLTLADLRGKIVLLDFWTYGCINCLHVIPELKQLEEKYAEELVVIGVHSAKFENEGETENIRRIVQRYELEHPVVNDNEFAIWNRYGARAWPTFVLIDPRGNVVGSQAGENIYDLFDYVIGEMITEFEGEIDRTPLNLVLEREGLANSPLLFPGKVLADAESGRLFIADSNHNRIVITDLDGRVTAVAGSGRAGLLDGPFASARFFRPQGLALAGDVLYVADTENSAIRKLDLANQTVETVAGTGQQVFQRATSGPAATTDLNSPWDVLYHDGLLYIAMAGQHQIWAFDPQAATVARFAGSGREELKDGPLTEAGLNQPSGLATDGNLLYIADSEASAIRAANLELDEGELSTIVGTGLFEFGDSDGVGDEVRLQHPLGVVHHEGTLYVADTYNSKIKIIDPQTREARTLAGRTAGWRDGVDPFFDEPGGLSIAGERLFIADTNNHAIRVLDLREGTTSTLVLIDEDGLLTRQPGEEYAGRVITLDEQRVGAGTGRLRLEITLPDGYKVNDLAPFSMEWTGMGETVALSDPDQTIVEPDFPLEIVAAFSPGQTTLTGDLVIYYCEEQALSLCLIEQVRLVVPLSVEEQGAATLALSYSVPGPPEGG